MVSIQPKSDRHPSRFITQRRLHTRDTVDSKSALRDCRSRLSASILLVGLVAVLGGCQSSVKLPEGSDASLLQEQEFLPATRSELGQIFSGARADRVEVFADRHEYRADELYGQFLVAFLGKVTPEEAESRVIVLELKRVESGEILESKTITPVQSPKLPVLIPTIQLQPGAYELTAKLQDKDGKVLERASKQFTRSNKSAERVPFPRHGIPIHVHAQDHVPDGAWPIATGVPMPKGTLLEPSELSLLENGKLVSAQFITRATWTPKGYVKWVGVDFVARYDNGKPREYRLVKGKGAKQSAQIAAQTDDRIVVDTGVLQFEIDRKQFAGIEKASVNGQLVVDGAGGSFVVDEKGTRYDSSRCTNVVVEVEENGPLQTTVAAKGWYTSEKGEELCKFAIRFKAYKGQPLVIVSHRTVNTIPDRYLSTRLSDVGFEIVPKGGITKWRYGFDGNHQEGTGAAFLHQDRGDHFRLIAGDEKLAEGEHSDGWVAAETPNGTVSYFLRDIYQKFPKELEIDATSGQPKIVAHFWPKHGHNVFTKEEEIARDQIYKVRFAHQGKLLAMQIPDHYHKRLEELDKEENWTAGGGELVIVDHKKNISKMKAASGQGSVIGSELVIRFDAKPQSTTAQTAFARLVQQSPHALADPEWNCATGVWGPVAARDPQKFGPAETMLDNAYSFYRRAIIESGNEYGMWIYGGVHNNWEAHNNQAGLKRVWQMSHYQNVFQAWLLYFRSGLPEHFEWARIHSNQHLDVGVCSYLAYPEGTHSYSRFGDMGGNIYHCKGFMPWAGNSSTGGHWIDIANYFIRYYLTGDRRGLDMADRWFRTVNLMGTSNELVLPTECDGYQDYAKVAEIDRYRKEHPDVKDAELPQWMREELAKPRRFNPREVFVPLGETVQYYHATWDPQALIVLDNLAEHLNPPFDCTNSPSLASFGKHWQDWYYDLTRDERVVERIREYMESERRRDRSPNEPSFAAFLYHATGDKSFIEPLISDIYGQMLDIYECEGDRYDGWCRAESNPASMLFGRLPYFLHAVDAAGLRFEMSNEHTSIPSRGGRVDMADKWLMPPRGWSNTGATILARASRPTKIAIAINGPRSYGDLLGMYQLHYGFPELNAFNRPDAAEELRAKQKASVVTFSAANRFNDPPEYRNFGIGRPDNPQRFPYVECSDNDPSQHEYRLEVGGWQINLPAFVECDTEEPLPQVAVIARTMSWGGKTNEVGSASKGVMDVYFRPLETNDVIDLRFASEHRRYYQPTRIKLTDARGKVVLDTSIFMAGKRKEAATTLDPAKHPLPWHLLMVSHGDNTITFQGAPELFVARKPDEFGKILPHLHVYDGETPKSLTANECGFSWQHLFFLAVSSV